MTLYSTLVIGAIAFTAGVLGLFWKIGSSGPGDDPYKDIPVNNVEVYRQDWENHRKQDRERWNRFQTASVVQGAFVYAIFVLPDRLSSSERVGIAFLGAAIVFTICGLALKDEVDARACLARITAYHRDNNIIWKAAKKPWGKYLVVAQIGLVVLLNFAILLKVVGDYARP